MQKLNINSSKEDTNNTSESDSILTSNEKNNNTDYEGLPILSQMEPIKTSLEDYYQLNYPEHKIIKFHNFTFIKMGKLLTFSFDKKDYIPKFSIGPHWYLTLVLLVLIIGLTYFIYSTIFKDMGFIFKFILVLFILIQYFFVLKTALTHAKVVMNKKQSIENNGFCNICKVYYNPSNKVEHCNFCLFCFEKMDHHCVWVGKCVAKNNTFYFYGMIVNICFLYTYIIICGIFYAIKD